jgi:hypothetical protein
MIKKIQLLRQQIIHNKKVQVQILNNRMMIKKIKKILNLKDKKMFNKKIKRNVVDFCYLFCFYFYGILNLKS